MPHLIMRHVKHPTANITLFAQLIDKSQVRIVGVVYGLHDCYKGIPAKLSTSSLLRGYSKQLKDILNGKALTLNRIKLSFDGYTDFQKKVLKTARSIPKGCTISYKELAQMSGYPKAVRAVANVMRHNPFPLVIPCHRVIRSDGSIGGFAGKASGSNIRLKRKLLKREGVTL